MGGFFRALRSTYTGSFFFSPQRQGDPLTHSHPSPQVLLSQIKPHPVRALQSVLVTRESVRERERLDLRPLAPAFPSYSHAPHTDTSLNLDRDPRKDPRPPNSLPFPVVHITQPDASAAAIGRSAPHLFLLSSLATTYLSPNTYKTKTRGPARPRIVVLHAGL